LVIYGTGAVGGLVGGKLALSGHTVTFLARPAVAKAIQARGLRIVSGDLETTVRGAVAVTTPEQALQVQPDCIILAVKSFATAATIEQIRGLGLRPAAILCLQNGVGNEAALAQAFGAEHVIAGTVTTTVTMEAPGTVIVQRERGVGLVADGPLGRSLAHALAGAGFYTQTFSDAAGMKWSKVLVNLIGNATSAICDIGTSQVFDHPGLYSLEIAALRECLAVMRAKGIPAVNLPRTPTGWLAVGLQYLPHRGLQFPLRYLLRDARGGKMPSFHADVVRGRGQSEIGWLNGAVARHGEEAGIPTPVNRLLTDTLESILSGRIAWDEYRGKPERLVAELKA
jgi:2-dehydropantoate 2-reductase